MSTSVLVTPEQFVEQFQSAVDFQDPVEMTTETVLKSLPEWDSLAALAVIVMFDVEHGKTITGADIKKCTTVGDLLALLQA